jgi:hypothetical protein
VSKRSVFPADSKALGASGSCIDGVFCILFCIEQLKVVLDHIQETGQRGFSAIFICSVVAEATVVHSLYLSGLICRLKAIY